MYLKAIELQGFKSFPQKTRLTFEKSVTGIVGPNGSGKSNIADALRWVMGEQSTKNLRGGKMEDVIFAGTERRGSVGFAEVSLILDNSDHIFNLDSEEVMVTRRYYRSGDSEYQINRQNVRLKDINELFMDTGLGREGYSIIGQGKIDEILSAKSTDRREIFEEAAGISRFRHRKEESERRLEKAEENLLRVNDKIAELELQVGPLREQAAVAKKYLLLRDELRDLDISLWTDRLNLLMQEISEVNASYNSALEASENCSVELEKLYAEGENALAAMQENDVQTEAARQQVADTEKCIADNNSTIAVLESNLKNNADSMERIRLEFSRQESQESGINSQITAKTDRVNEIDSRIAEVYELLNDVGQSEKNVISRADLAASELASLVSSEAEVKASIAAKEAKIESSSDSLQNSEDRLTELLSDLNTMSDRIASEQQKADENSALLEEQRKKITSQQNMIRGYQLRLESRKNKYQQLSDKSNALKLDIDRASGRISTLEEMEKEYQGYNKAVKLVMQESARGNLRNVYGTVADLMETEDKYSVAIEIALGGALQDIVVNSENDAKYAISFLKQRDGGRATFLPVSTIRGSRLELTGFERSEGFIGLAVDLVKFNAKFADIYTNLLGRIVIVEDIDDAINISRSTGHKFRLVTMDGQVVNAGGSMTGGSVNRNSGIISRANELKKLAAYKEKIESELQTVLAAEEEAKREFAAVEYEMTVLSDELRVLEDTELKLQGTENQYAILLSALRDNAASIETEIETQKNRIANEDSEIQRFSDSITQLKAELSKITLSISNQTSDNEKLEAERKSISDKIFELRSEITGLSTERSAILDAVENLKNLRSELSSGMQEQSSLLERTENQNKEILIQIKDAESRGANLSALLETYKNKISSLISARGQLEATRTLRDRDVQNKNKELLDYQRDVSVFEQRKVSLEMEEKQLVDKLWENYELSRSAAFEVRHPIEDVPAAQKRSNELKKQISALGNPNIGSIEEYDRVNERYTFLSEQRDDISKSRNELLGIIGDITSEMKEIFSREFQSINDSFKQTFLELFGGGRANLYLEDPDDILGCGIEIQVQPPGKALKTISLLSGGEKAFVAIALYFSILKIRPTPFVVMDEIEAALDDVNVTKFATYMRNFTEKTQFLVITHRRGTMEEADLLYGVTMQERGVSQVLAVDLEEAEKTIAQ